MKGGIMNGLEAFENVVKASGMSMRAVSLACGRSQNYVASLLTQGSKPTADTLALVGKACGYQLALVPSCEHLPPGSIVIGD